jgi:hypothetical protein
MPVSAPSSAPEAVAGAALRRFLSRRTAAARQLRSRASETKAPPARREYRARLAAGDLATALAAVRRPVETSLLLGRNGRVKPAGDVPAESAT